ncbi:MAG TPA: AAA family ATPase [Solirubrobacteraceae bacterium]|jgi:DNA-binding CsgD family transcriptional regulator|nr:AAA family ATPase [Solirubrobacteraceae bacterium]
MLLGRRSECEALDSLLAAVRGGHSGALVVRGEPGVGKTALLERAIESAPDLTVVRAVGVESEMELAFAALHQLCAPMLDRLERLPRPQRDALRSVFGLGAAEVPDRFLVGLAVLGLLSEVGEEHPLLCVVDDAQWLDRASAQALGFVARRLVAESVGLVFAARDPSEEFRGLPELVVEGLRDGDARDLLDSVVGGPLDERVREQIVAETRGNPLALLELPRGLSPAQLAGGFGLPAALPLPDRIEESFLRRLEALPEATRLFLLVAASEPVGDPALLRLATERIGLSAEAGDDAQRAGLLEVGGRVRFRHPLVRSAVYRAASLDDRQKVHAALAEVTDPRIDPDRRAWHRAHATGQPDEDVATELERSAGRAQARGGLAAAAAFFERAVKLTPDPSRRAQRALAAAQAKHLAGAPDTALELLVTAESGPLDELGRARVDMLRAQIAFASSRGSDAPPLLLRAASRLEPLDLRLARDTYLDALSAAEFAGSLARGSGVLDVAQATRAAPQPPGQPRPSDLLLDGLTTRFTDGYVAAAPMLKRALAAFRSADISREEELRWIWLPCRTAVDLWDDETWDVLATRHVDLAREAGALAVLPLALSMRMSAHTYTGGLSAASTLIEELHAATDATGSELPPYGALLLAAWQGREPDTSELIDATIRDVVPRGEALGLAAAHWASAVLYNGLGRYEDALVGAGRATEHPEDLPFFNWSLVELIEAAARSGDFARAGEALEQLSEMTSASGTDWALGIEARSRALLSEGDEAERLHREAIHRLSRTRVRVPHARAHLVYGEWLRRERRRLDAREQLRTAHEMFAAMGVEAFAQRAGRELLATGERARKRTMETREDLTAQEIQIARLARDGLSNPEIGQRLFISPRTVEYHLHKVFTKLGVSSRNQLDSVLAAEPGAALAV